MLTTTLAHIDLHDALRISREAGEPKTPLQQDISSTLEHADSPADLLSQEFVASDEIKKAFPRTHRVTVPDGHENNYSFVGLPLIIAGLTAIVIVLPLLLDNTIVTSPAQYLATMAAR